MRVISLGAGVQSSALVYLASEGIIQADFAIFADTGNERKATYDYLNYLQEHSKIPIYKAKNQRINGKSIIDELESCITDDLWYEGMPPFWFTDSKGNGQARQQCTKFYKIKVVEKFINIKWREQRTENREQRTMLIGISTDEIHRANTGRDEGIKREFPLIKLRMSRKDCADYILSKGHPLPPKSGCIICPYQGSKNIKTLTEQEKQDLIRWDEMIRNGFAKEKTKGRFRQYFISSRRIPMQRLIQMEDQQQDLFEEDPGCDSGFCMV